MAYSVSAHPLKRLARRMNDMLLMGAPLWKVAQTLEISEATIRRHYGHVLEQHERKAGPARYEASPKDRDRVKLMAIAGIPQDDIAKVLGVCKQTLYDNYREELDLGLIEANTRVAGNLLMMATGPRDQKTTVTAAIWWTKSRMGWKDTSRIEQTGADGGPIQTENQVVVILPDNGRGGSIIDGSAEDTDPDDDDDSSGLFMLPTTPPDEDGGAGGGVADIEPPSEDE